MGRPQDPAGEEADAPGGPRPGAREPPPSPEGQVQSPSGRRLSPERGSARRGPWKAGRLRAPSSRLLRTLEPEARLDPETAAPVNVPCPRRSLCWRREPSQGRERFQTKPASRRREWCLRKPPSSRRPRPPRRSRPQAGPRPQRGPRPGFTQPQRSACPARGAAGCWAREGARVLGRASAPGWRPPARHSARMLRPRSPRRHGPHPPSATPCSAPAPHHLLPDEPPERQVRGGLNPQRQCEAPGQLGQIRPEAGAIPFGHTEIRVRQVCKPVPH